MEAVMQKRFCSCGHPVLVSYTWLGRGASRVHAAFYALQRREGGRIGVCPVCGKRLDIDQLK
jgi:hypothetical protein